MFKFFGDGNSVNVSKIYEKSKNDITTNEITIESTTNVLSCLYRYALLTTNYAPRNMFSLPLERSCGKINYDQNKLRNEKIDSFQRVRDKYISGMKNINDSYERFSEKDRYLNSIYLKKDNDYDFVRLEYVNKDANGNTILFHDNGYSLSFEEQAKRTSQIRSIHLVEEKQLKRVMDIMDLENVLKIAAKMSNHYINRLDGIIIKNKFDGSHIYDIKGYDQAYGTGAFINSLIKEIPTNIDDKGDASIKNQHTVEYIKKIALSVTNNRKELANRLVKDFIDNTEHSNNDTSIYMGKLMDLYNIDGYELLYVMYKGSNGPISLVTLADSLSRKAEAEKFSIDDAKKIVERKYDHDERKYSHVEYLYGIGIKNSFRRNKGEGQYIYIKGYNNRGGNFYKSVFTLMKHKLENNELKN
jgi:hypothetical protein